MSLFLAVHVDGDYEDDVDFGVEVDIVFHVDFGMGVDVDVVVHFEVLVVVCSCCC